MTTLTALEQEIFQVAGAHLASQAEAIVARVDQHGLSCEGYINHLFAMSLASHRLICMREVPYIDLGALEAHQKAALDLMVLTPDKSQAVCIETKLVHDTTQDSYRDRLSKNGNSIHGDILKIENIPATPGRSRLLMVVMLSLGKTGSSADWENWLTKAPKLKHNWLRLTQDKEPLFKLGDEGWFDILIHKGD